MWRARVRRRPTYCTAALHSSTSTRRLRCIMRRFCSRHRAFALAALPLLLSLGAVTPAHAARIEVVLASERAATTARGNPFEVDVRVTAEHVSTGHKIAVGAFFDGQGVWRARFSCSGRPGQWRWASTVASGPADGGLEQRGEAVCGDVGNATDHGGLLVDHNNPHHFVWADGTRYFPVSYECDWLFALGLEADSSPTTLDAFLDSLAGGGFNMIVLNFYANHSSWDHAPPQYKMETRMTPWASADKMTLNLLFWQHFDTVLDAMQSRGIVAHIMVMVENKFVDWPPQQSPADDLYWRTVVDRYQAYDNVVWDVSKEAHRWPASYWATRFAIIEQRDTHRRLRTVHTGESHADFVPLETKDCQFISHQQHGDYHDHILRVRQQFPTEPVFNIEFLYEMGRFQTYGPQSRPEDMRPVLWSIYMAGGYANWYVSTTAWDVLVPDDVTPGYAYCMHLRAFFESTQYWLLEPNDAIVSKNTSAAYAMADAAGTEVVAYLEQAGPFSLNLPSGGWAGTWFDPRTGQAQPAGNVTGGSEQSFTPPSFYTASGDVALHLERSSA